MTGAEIRALGTELGLPNVRASRVRGGVWIISWGYGVERERVELPATATLADVQAALQEQVPE